MNWQLCSPIFLAALLESLLNKPAEILKLLSLRGDINQDLNPEMFFCLSFSEELGNELHLNGLAAILKQFCFTRSLPRSSKFHCV